MLYDTLPQAIEFAAMLLAGAAMGAAALALSYVRRLMRAGLILSFVCDLFLGVLWAILACAALTIACRGRARVYHFAGMALGGALLYAALSPILRAFARFIGTCGAKAARRMGTWRVVRVLLK
ncbi:MAG: spore cortex biosynthesis protein YabQ [Christensenellales bacterium]|jgi:hypothetical protein